MKGMKEQFKIILNITKYSILMFFRERTAVYFSLFIPLLIMTIFGLLNLDQGTSVSLGVVDKAHNQVSTQFVDSLKKIDALAIHESDEAAEMETLKKGDRDLVIILPQNFGANIAAYQQQRALAASAKLETQNIEIYENGNKTNTDVQIGATILDKVFDQFTHQVSGTPNLFKLEPRTVESKEHSYIDFIVPGVVAMSVMQLGIMGVVGAIVSWRERGILKRLLATPIKPSNVIFAQIVTRLIITMAQVGILITVGIIFFKLSIEGSLGLVFLLTLLGGIVFLAMGFALSGVATSQNSVMAIANLVMMPQMFLSGVFFPREALPELLQKITNYFPLTYLSDGMRQVMNQGANIFEIRQDVIGLAVWALIIFAISSRSFRWE